MSSTESPDDDDDDDVACYFESLLDIGDAWISTAVSHPRSRAAALNLRYDI